MLGPTDSDLSCTWVVTLYYSSVSQLETLATDRHALRTFVKKLHSVQEFSKLREDVMTGNMRIAETTLAHESEMRALQVEVQALRSSLREAQELLAQKQSRQSRVLAVRSLSVTVHASTIYSCLVCSHMCLFLSVAVAPPPRCAAGPALHSDEGARRNVRRPRAPVCSRRSGRCAVQRAVPAAARTLPRAHHQTQQDHATLRNK